MIGARGRAFFIGGLAILAAVSLALVTWTSRRPALLPARPAVERPGLLLLTSLPLVFGEDFSVEENGSPVLRALQSRYRIIPISVTDPTELAQGRLLLMAQPIAQPAEDLVALDGWVRGGGRLLLFADPMLEWPSKRPLGDALRPPAMFMDTGLLAHWGLRLDAPDQTGRTRRRLGGVDVLTVSPGRLSGTCRIGDDGLVARCRLGKGQAIVVADADLLDTSELGAEAADNLGGLLRELASLERK